MNLKAYLRRIPGLVAFLNAGRGLRYRFVLRFSRRRNYTFTQFARIPTQLEVLAGPALEYLRLPSGTPLSILLFGSSTGAEPYSLASVIHGRHPDLSISLRCFDIEPALIERGRSARYTKAEVNANPMLPAGFLAETFDVSGQDLVVKPSIAAGVRFELGNLLDYDLVKGLGQANMVIAQNFLYHLSRSDAEQALRHLFQLLAPRAVLAVDGMDLDLRARLTEDAGLLPLDVSIEAIHREARVERGYAWPTVYWGLEPFNRTHPDWRRRYATVFLRNGTPAGR